jgi:hypothetical protein
MPVPVAPPGKPEFGGHLDHPPGSRGGHGHGCGKSGPLRGRGGPLCTPRCSSVLTEHRTPPTVAPVGYHTSPRPGCPQPNPCWEHHAQTLPECSARAHGHAERPPRIAAWGPFWAPVIRDKGPGEPICSDSLVRKPQYTCQRPPGTGPLEVTRYPACRREYLGHVDPGHVSEPQAR